MTPAEQELNVALCEWRGWKNNLDILDCWNDPQGFVHANLPNHIDDITSLGHVHEAEKGLTDEQYNTTYWSLLHSRASVGYGVGEGNSIPRRVLSATAKQRTIAILTVVNPTFIEAWKTKYPNE
jgi:hypothetical protein